MVHPVLGGLPCLNSRWLGGLADCLSHEGLVLYYLAQGHLPSRSTKCHVNGRVAAGASFHPGPVVYISLLLPVPGWVSWGCCHPGLGHRPRGSWPHMESRDSAGVAGHLGHQLPSQAAELEVVPVTWRRCTSPGWKTPRVSTRLAPLCVGEKVLRLGCGGGSGEKQLACWVTLGKFLCLSGPPLSLFVKELVLMLGEESSLLCCCWTSQWLVAWLETPRWCPAQTHCFWELPLPLCHAVLCPGGPLLCS